MRPRAEAEVGPAGARRADGRTGGRRLAVVAAALAVAIVAAHGARAQTGGPPRLDEPDVALEGRFEAAPSRRVYAAIAEQTGLAINVDPQVREVAVSIDLGGLRPLAALDRVANLAGHFVVPVDARTAQVVQDTPQNRKLHEALGVRTFVLRHAHPAEVMTALRTLIDARRLVPTESPPRVTVRDTYPKLEVAARIVEMLDREPWEVRLRIELLPAEARLLRELAEAGDELSAEGAEALRRRRGPPLAAGVVSLVGNRTAEWKAFDTGEGPSADAGGEEGRLLSLTARGWLAPDDRLGLELDLSVLAPGEPRLNSLRQTSTFRLAAGRSLALPILLRGGGGAAAGDAWILLLTPRIAERGELDSRPFDTFWIGSEANIVGVR